MLILDTFGSRPEEETNVRLQTPESSPSVESAEPPISRELFVDVTCVDLLRPLFESKGIKVIPVDVGAVLSSSSAGSLSEATAIVIGPQVRMGLNAIAAVEQLRAALPHVGLYVVARSTGDIARTLPRLAISGVDEVFSLDVEADVDAMLTTMSQRLAAPLPVTEIRLLWKWFRESPERSLVMHCVRNGFRLDIWEIRSRLFMQSRKNLHNRMIVAGLPSPGILSRCGRVLHAQELERRGGIPATRIATLLGFRTPGALLRCRRRLRNALLTRGRNSVVFISLLK